MNQNKLTAILGTLNQQELHKFDKFLRSPFFNEISDLSKLFDFLWEAAKKEEQQFFLPDKEKLWAKVFRN